MEVLSGFAQSCECHYLARDCEVYKLIPANPIFVPPASGIVIELLRMSTVNDDVDSYEAGLKGLLALGVFHRTAHPE
jgi:hypothetical protein